MRAAVLTRFGGPFELVDDVEIDDPGPGEVLVKITHCGVCHSDLTVFEGGEPTYPLPVILGHEAAGVVEKLGPDVKTRAIGQSVVLSMRAPCGQCYQCARGAPVLCEQGQSLSPPPPRAFWRGAPIVRGFGLGAFADFALARVEGAVPISADTPPSIAAVVGCAVQTGVGAVQNIAKMPPGASCVIIGAGTVGVCVVQGAALAGASSIIVVDPNEARRQSALALGATLAFDPGEPNLIDRIRAATGMRGADYAFDLVCTAETPELAIAAIRPGGHAILIGVKSNHTRSSLLTTPIVMQQKHISGCLLGNCHPQRDFPVFLELWRAGRLAIDKLVTAVRPLAEIDEAMADLQAGRGLRTVLAFA